MVACDHSRRRSGRPAAAQIDTFAIEAHITTTAMAEKNECAAEPLTNELSRSEYDAILPSDLDHFAALFSELGTAKAGIRTIG